MRGKLLVLLLALSMGQGSRQPIPIPIQIPSFELGYGQTLSVPLAVSPKTVQAPSSGWEYVTEGMYALKFSVQNRLTTYPGYYTAEIDFGTQELCEASGWSTSTPCEVVLTCPSPGYLILDKALPGGTDNQGTENLVVKFTVNDGSWDGGWPVKFVPILPSPLSFTPN